MRLFLGTHEPGWLGRSPAPLFISLARRDRFCRRHRPAPWALDSGGFTQVTMHGGWAMPASEYLDAVYELADSHPDMVWAAPQDWMCEPLALAATGLDVAEHQRRTVDNFCQLRQLDQRRLVIPVLQGYAAGEHEQCIDLYARAGVDLERERLVGIGTICRRQATSEIAGIVRALASSGLALHGFGVKTLGLVRYGEYLSSADSLAWSYRARKAARHDEGPLGTGCTHRSCANCFVWAHEWHAAIAATPRQMVLL